MKITTLKRKYKNQWVAAKVLEVDEYGWPEEVEVIATSPNRQTVSQKLTQAKIKHVPTTVLYTGKKPKRPTILTTQRAPTN